MTIVGDIMIAEGMMTAVTTMTLKDHRAALTIEAKACVVEVDEQVAEVEVTTATEVATETTTGLMASQPLCQEKAWARVWEGKQNRDTEPATRKSMRM